MKVAIVGSRTYPRLELVATYVLSLPDTTVIISGGAQGVDKTAEQVARYRHLKVEIYPAEWNKWGRSAGMMRNGKIINAADRVVAFWDGISKGTADSIRKARAAGKPVTVFDALGNEVK